MLQTININKLVLAVVTIAVVATAGFLSTRAFFSDTETSQGNVFAAGSLDLEVGIWDAGDEDNFMPKSIPGNQALFAFSNLIPGDTGTGRFLFESSQDAWLCVAGDITAEDDNTRLPVETAAGDNTPNIGELGQFMQIAVWQDNNNNGDGVVGSGEKASLQVMSLYDFANGDYHSVQDSTNGSKPLLAGDVNHQEFAYCFGEFSNVNDVKNNGGTLDCNGGAFGSDTNKAQTDSVETTIHFYAEQMQSNENFACSDVGLGNPILNAENFNTHDDGYYTGFNVGWNQDDFGTVSSIVIDVEFQDSQIVSRTSDQGVIDWVNIDGYTQLSVPFIAVSGGSYTTAGDTNPNNNQPYWQVQTHTTNDAVWNANNPPVKATITVTGSNGTQSVTNVNLAEPNAITWASLFTN